MIVYHRTSYADAIEREGFRDGYYLMPPPVGELRGVFVSADWPLDENEGADGDTVLAVEIPDELFVEHEHVEEGKTYREAMIPADRLNEHLASVRRLTGEEEEELLERRHATFWTPDGQLRSRWRGQRSGPIAPSSRGWNGHPARPHKQ